MAGSAASIELTAAEYRRLTQLGASRHHATRYSSCNQLASTRHNSARAG
jgi:hypothetical protein